MARYTTRILAPLLLTTVLTVHLSSARVFLSPSEDATLVSGTSMNVTWAADILVQLMAEGSNSTLSSAPSETGSTSVTSTSLDTGTLTTGSTETTTAVETSATPMPRRRQQETDTSSTSGTSSFNATSNETATGTVMSTSSTGASSSSTADKPGATNRDGSAAAEPCCISGMPVRTSNKISGGPADTPPLCSSLQLWDRDGEVPMFGATNFNTSAGWFMAYTPYVAAPREGNRFQLFVRDGEGIGEFWSHPFHIAPDA
ncbi:hypothetical protein BD413DRAFT_73913 [Trametes elegans]|nr:hypothetical protein BD413DRAFT_73913 [Trametes elegans]